MGVTASPGDGGAPRYLATNRSNSITTRIHLAGVRSGQRLGGVGYSVPAESGRLRGALGRDLAIGAFRRRPWGCMPSPSLPGLDVATQTRAVRLTRDGDVWLLHGPIWQLPAHPRRCPGPPRLKRLSCLTLPAQRRFAAPRGVSPCRELLLPRVETFSAISINCTNSEIFAERGPPELQDERRYPFDRRLV